MVVARAREREGPAGPPPEKSATALGVLRDGFRPASRPHPTSLPIATLLFTTHSTVQRRVWASAAQGKQGSVTKGPKRGAAAAAGWASGRGAAGGGASAAGCCSGSAAGSSLQRDGTTDCTGKKEEGRPEARVRGRRGGTAAATAARPAAAQPWRAPCPPRPKKQANQHFTDLDQLSCDGGLARAVVRERELRAGAMGER